MTTGEIIAQNPVLWLVYAVGGAVIAAVGITWKVLESVRVKPKDDRIKDLNEDTEKLRHENARLRQDQERPLAEFRKQIESFKAQLEESERKRASLEAEMNVSPFTRKSPPSTTAIPLLPEISVNQNVVIPEGCTPQTSLRVLYEMWKGDGITDLQKKKFEKDYIGKQVCWKVQVSSVKPSADDIVLAVLDTTEAWGHASAWGVFPLSAESSLLPLKKDTAIVLRGTISDFRFMPSLKQCEFERIVPH